MGGTHWPCESTWPPGQLVGGTHTPPDRVSPAGQPVGGTHTPFFRVSPAGQPVGEFVSQEGLPHGFHGSRTMRFRDPEEPDKDAVFRQMAGPLLGRALGGKGVVRRYVAPPAYSGEGLQLFIFARSPEGFELKHKRFGKEMGYVLYHLALPGSGL